MIKLPPLNIQNSTSGAVTPGKDKVGGMGAPLSENGKENHWRKCTFGVGNMKKVDDKKSKSRRKNQTEEEDRKRKENCRKWGWGRRN